MGIESDKVVYEYLSRVGDVAQQRQLPSATRMRLVTTLRDEIDKRRAKAVVDSPAAVRRIIERLGSPDEVVSAAGGTGSPEPPPSAVPEQREPRTAPQPAPQSKGLGRFVPRPRPTAPPAPAPSGNAASPPHLASAAELGGPAVPPDWWRADTGAFGTAVDEVPGFTGGVEIPELLKPPPRPQPKAEGPAEAVPEADEEEPEETAPPRRRRLALPTRRWSNPLLVLAAVSLVAGAVLGNWFALLLGWAIAYASRRLTEAETKWAVMGLPGGALAAGLVWLWGRGEGRWGEPIAEGQMSDAIAQTWPWVVRGAAVASALFLLWRSQRKR
ncbi:hypothetical protein ACFWII_11870 [Streptomyces sp. NPDC127063]|uniref:hypothetical protein n=1 Tax=Streptomyces sp. NPDC127063 TaxID=3347123 RepID=UPI00365BC796